MKKSAAYVAVSVVCLSLASLGLDLRAQAKTVVAPSSLATPSGAKTDDVDLVGVVGDEVLSGCKPNADCSKSWQALGQLAAKSTP